MKAYVYLVNNYVVTVMYEPMDGFVEVELPEDFDYSHIDWYEYVEGQLVYNDLSEDIITPPSYEERIAALEKQNAELVAQLAAYEESYAKGVQEA